MVFIKFVTLLNVRSFSSWQVNPEMVDSLEAAGLRFVGKDETGRRMEVSLISLP